MSNLYKSAYVVQKESESRVIDSNEIVARKIQKLTEIMEAEVNKGEDGENFDGFVEGLDAVAVESLLEDPEANVPESDAYESQVAAARDELEILRQQADEVIKDAKENAKEIQSKAEKEAAAICDEARQNGYNDGYDKGYNEGLLKAQEAEERFNANETMRQQEYERQISELEPMLVSTLCDIYEHVIGIEVAGKSNIVMHLLSRALRTIEGGINYLVHVSSDDFAYATEHKNELTAILGSTNTLEIIEDITLTQGQSFIETESGIYDCSFGIEMELLRKEIMILSREDN